MRPFETSVLAAPTAEPVTLAEAKAQLRVENNIEDVYISALIAAARDRVENYCNRYFTEQQIRIDWEGPFPVMILRLPFPDLATVDTIGYTDTDTADQTVAGTDYVYQKERRTITPVTSWPSDAVAFYVTATTASPLVADAVKQAILMIVTDLYELRVESLVGASIAVNPAVAALLQPYRFNLGI